MGTRLQSQFDRKMFIRSIILLRFCFATFSLPSHIVEKCWFDWTNSKKNWLKGELAYLEKKHKLDLVLLKHWTQQWEKLFEKGRLPQKLLTRDDLTSYLMKRPTSATKECLNGRWGAIAHQLYVYYRMLFEFVYSREIWRLEHFFFTDMIFFSKNPSNFSLL